jgi:hypothetical protein
MSGKDIIKANSSSLFKELDIFGVGYNFLVDGKNKKKTVGGALLSILYGFIFIALFFGFGMDLYQRKRPKVSFSTVIGEYHEIPLSNKNFTYAYRVEDSVGKLVTDESIIYHNVHYFKFTLVDGEWVNDFENILPNKRCREVAYTEEKEKYYNISLNDWYCIDFDNVTLGGNWDGNFLHGFQINTNQCSNSTDRTNCSSQDVIKHSFQSDLTSSNYFYSDMSLEVLASMDDFESPLKTNLVNRYDILSLALTKRKVQTFKATKMINDVGWFFSEVNEFFMASSDTLTTDFSFKDIWSQDIVYSQFLYFGKKTETFNRSYTKIQEIFAAIGGFSKFFYYAISLFYYATMKVYRNLFLMNNIFFDNNEEENFVQQNNLKRNSQSGLNLKMGANKPYSHDDIKDKNLHLNNSTQNILLNHNVQIDNYLKDYQNNPPHTSKNNNTSLDNKFGPNSFPNQNPNKININFPHVGGNQNNPCDNIISNPVNLSNSGLDYQNIQTFVLNNLNSLEIKKRILPNNKITFLDYVKYRICIKQKSKKILVPAKLKSYVLYEKYFEHKMDILSYFDLHNQFKQFMKLFLDKEDRKLIKATPAKLNKNKSYRISSNSELVEINVPKISLPRQIVDLKQDSKCESGFISHSLGQESETNPHHNIQEGVLTK